MTHLTREALVRWRDAGSPSDRDDIVDHLAVCDTCGAVYADLIRTQPLEGAPTRFDARGFVKRGYGVYRPGRSPVRALLAWRGAPLAAAAAAALLILAVVVPSIRRSAESPAQEELRGPEIQLVSPAGRVTTPVRFRWTSPVPASKFLLEVYDANRRLLYSASVDRDEAELTPALQAQLKPGAPYWCKVTALDAGGEPLMASNFHSFEISAP